MQVLTFGRSTAAAEKIARLLRGVEVRRVVDVRTAPTSRHNPDATRDAMSRWLSEVGINYQWDKRLGGWRKAPADTHDTVVRNQSFAATRDTCAHQNSCRDRPSASRRNWGMDHGDVRRVGVVAMLSQNDCRLPHVGPRCRCATPHARWHAATPPAPPSGPPTS